MARNSKFRRMLALFMTFVMILTMMPANVLEVHAGGGYTQAQLKSFIKDVKVSWLSGAGTAAKFRVEITMNADAPENVIPGDLYVAAGKNISEEALKQGYPSTFYVGAPGTETTNSDGTKTYTYDQGAYFGDGPFLDAKKALNNAIAGTQVLKDSLSGTDEEKEQTGNTLIAIQKALNDATEGMMDDDYGKALEDANGAKKSFSDNKDNLQTTMQSDDLKKLEDGLDSAVEALETLKGAQDNVNDENSDAAAVAAAALEAANEADEHAQALTDAQSKDEFVNSFTVAEDASEEQASTFSGFLGKSWLAIIAARTYCGNAKAALSKEEIAKSVCGATETAQTNLGYAQNYGVEEAKEYLESAKELASEESQADIDKLIKEDENDPGAIPALEKKIEDAKELVGELEGKAGIGLDVSQTATVGISVYPNEDGMDEIIYIGEVRHPKAGPEPADDEHTVTVTYVMGTNSKGETIPEPAGFTKSESKTYKKGVEYDIPSPFYSGYTASVERISGTMGDTNVAETVTYSCSHPSEPAAVIKQKGAWGHQWYCGQCGDLLGEEEHHTDTADYDYTKDGHTPHCSICDWKSPVEVAHKKLYSQVKVNGSQRHWVQCSVCNYEGYESHEWSKAEGYGDEGCFAKCVCGAFYSYPTHKFTKYESGPKGKHDRVCAICGVREEENCDTDGYRYKNSTEHEILCSKCNAVQGVENHGDAEICQHTAGSYHRTYCTKCNATTERNIPCTPSEMRKTDLQHFQTCIRCGYELESGNHRYPSTIYKVNQQADIASIDGKLVTYWTWDEVKRCSVCGNELKVGHGSSLGNGGGGSATKGSKNFGGGGPGPKPQIASSDTKLEELAGQNLNTNVVSSIDEVVMNNYFDLVSENKCDVLDEIAENSAALGNADPQDVNVIVEPTVTVTPTAYSRNSKTLSIEIDATYNIVLENNNDKSKKVTVLNNEKIPVNEPVDLCILLPDGFGAEGKTVNIDHEHNGEIHHYSGTIVKDGNKYYLPFTATAGFSPFTFTLVEEQSEDDVASVTYSYTTKNPAGTAVYKTAYFDSIESAFAATSEVDFEDQLTEEQQNNFESYKAPRLKLLKDVTVSGNTPVMQNNADATILDLNGHTLTIQSKGALIGDGELSLDSTTPGTIYSSGTIEAPLGMWTGDTVYISAGSVKDLSTDGGTLIISGGEVDFGGRMINNGGEAEINVTVSGDAKISNLTYVVYLDEEGNLMEGKPDIHLTLNGGYYDVDPETYKTGQMGGDPYDQSAYVTYDADKFEEYSDAYPQGDWNADPTVYRYRICGTPCAHEHKETRNVTAASCKNDGYTGDVFCLDCGTVITAGQIIKGGHDYTITYNWSDDGKSCTGTAVCKREGCAETDEGHSITEEATITSAVKTGATTEKKGVTTYTATFTVAPFETQTKDVEDIPKLEGTDNSDTAEQNKAAVSGNNAMSTVPEMTAQTKELHLVKGQSFALPDKKGWTTTDKKIVSISKGVLKAKKVTEAGKPVVINRPDGSAINVYVTEPKLNKNKLKLEAGVSENLIMNYNSEKLGILWESSAPDVATVSQNGLVTAISKGTAKITAHINGKSYTCKVTVTETTAAVSRVMHLNVGKTKAISLKKLGKLKWTSSDENIAKMLTQKKVKAITEGTAILTATDEKTKQVYNIKLIVDNPEIKTGKITLKKKTTYNLSMKVGETVPVEFKSVDGQVIFKSNKAARAYDNGKGGIRAIAAGKAKLTATVNKTKITINVTVE